MILSLEIDQMDLHYILGLFMIRNQLRFSTRASAKIQKYGMNVSLFKMNFTIRVVGLLLLEQPSTVPIMST